METKSELFSQLDRDGNSIECELITLHAPEFGLIYLAQIVGEQWADVPTFHATKPRALAALRRNLGWVGVR